MIIFDAHKNLAVGVVIVPPDPATSGTSLTLQTDEAARFPAAPFNVTVWPEGDYPNPENAEILRVTAVVGDTFTVLRAQEGTTPRVIGPGDLIAATITAKTLEDLENLTLVTQGEVVLPFGEALPDLSGSTNAPPLIWRRVSGGTQTANTPKVTEVLAQFDATIFEAMMAGWVLPTDYGSGGELVVKFSMASATTGNIRLRGGISVATDLSTLNHLQVFNASDTLDNIPVPGAAGQSKEVTLPLTMTGAAPGKKVVFFIHLGTASVSNATGDRVLESWRFRYTTAPA